MSVKYGLVLAGGGSKGAYEIGAYKALKELDIEIKGIVGTSIGAINGALMLQDDMDKIDYIYENIKIDNLMEINEEIDTDKDIFHIKNIVKLMKEYTTQRGISNEPLRKMIEENLDVNKIYNSNQDYGMVSYSLKSKEPLEVFKENINKEDFIDYLLASACFPIYKSQKIGDKEYSDGGFYDNIPVNMLVEKGYKNIIVLDLNGLGFVKRLKRKNVYVKIIKCSEDLGGIFELNQNTIKKNIKMGYLDTMKSFNKLEGHYFYFSKKEFTELLKYFSLDEIYGLETAARIYKMERYKVYEVEEFLTELKLKHSEVREKYEKVKTKDSDKNIMKKFKEVLSLVDRGFGVCFFEDLVNISPRERYGWFRKIFSEFISAACGIIELTNKHIEFKNK